MVRIGKKENGKIMQDNLNKEFEQNFEHTMKIVDTYLEMCWSCRNSHEHLRNHIHKRYPYLNSESIRRSAQKIQNTLGKHQADLETQAWRQAKQHFMEKRM